MPRNYYSSYFKILILIIVVVIFIIAQNIDIKAFDTSKLPKFDYESVQSRENQSIFDNLVNNVKKENPSENNEYETNVARDVVSEKGNQAGKSYYLENKEIFDQASDDIISEISSNLVSSEENIPQFRDFRCEQKYNIFDCRQKVENFHLKKEPVNLEYFQLYTKCRKL